MANNQIQVPPAVGSSGQHLDAIVISSSEMRQVVVVGDSASTGNLIGVNASGQITVAQASAARTVNIATSVIVTPSSNFTVAISSGTVGISSGTVTFSSAPTVNVSSGVITLSSNPTIVSASSGLIQLSSQITVTASGVVSLSSGTVTLSSAIALSSGIVSPSSNWTVVLSSPTSLSSGTVTLSSNPTVVSASSGVVGTLASTTKQYTVFQFNASSSNSLVNLTTANIVFHGWNAGNQTTSATAAIKCYDSTTATVGSTTNLKLTIPLPGGSAGGGSNMPLAQGVNFTSGITVVVTGNYASTSTGTTHSAGDVIAAFYYV